MVAFIVGYKARPLLNRTFSSSSSAGSGSVSSKKRKLDSAISEPASPARAGAAAGSGSSGSESSDEATDADSDAEDEAAALATDMASLKAYGGEEVKLVLVVNDSLKMAKGKIAAQAGHATLACALTLKEQNPRVSLTVHYLGLERLLTVTSSSRSGKRWGETGQVRSE